MAVTMVVTRVYSAVVRLVNSSARRSAGKWGAQTVVCLVCKLADVSGDSKVAVLVALKAEQLVVTTVAAMVVLMAEMMVALM
jgi:hypothetical protein